MKTDKPLGGPAYGSIPHLLNSRLGPGDHHCSPGQDRICQVKTRDKNDLVIIQEKMDGSNVCVANVDGTLLALNRSGYLASTSPFENHHKFDDWVKKNISRFAFLNPGERVCGEWLAMAHGTIYIGLEDLFYAFDIIRDGKRVGYSEWKNRIYKTGLWYAVPIPVFGPKNSEYVYKEFFTGFAGALNGPEGLVYRVYRNDKFDFAAKYVQPNKVDGKFLPEISGHDPVWMGTRELIPSWIEREDVLCQIDNLYRNPIKVKNQIN